jgi:hypothetical protein
MWNRAKPEFGYTSGSGSVEGTGKFLILDALWALDGKLF